MNKLQRENRNWETRKHNVTYSFWPGELEASQKLRNKSARKLFGTSQEILLKSQSFPY